MFNVTHLIEAGGLLVIALIIFAESGMMVGLFFPGDTLLLSAGVLAAGGKLPLFGIIVVSALAAIAGDNVGYQIGRTLGRRLFRKPDGLIFRHDYIMKAEAFYEKHGSKTMLLAHFFVVIRSFVPVTAGAARMPRVQYIIFDAIGDTAWAISVTLFGYFVGSRIPGIDRYIEPILLGAVLIVLVPTLYHIVRDSKIRSVIQERFKRSSS